MQAFNPPPVSVPSSERVAPAVLPSRWLADKHETPRMKLRGQNELPLGLTAARMFP